MWLYQSLLENAYKAIALWFYQILLENVSNFAWKCGFSKFAWKCVRGFLKFFLKMWLYLSLLENAYKAIYSLVVLSKFPWKCGFIKFCFKMYSLVVLSNFAWKCDKACLKMCTRLLSNVAWKCVQGYSLVVLSNFAWKCGYIKVCLKMRTRL